MDKSLKIIKTYEGPDLAEKPQLAKPPFTTELMCLFSHSPLTLQGY